jgi:hypothetical protein
LDSFGKILIHKDFGLNTDKETTVMRSDLIYDALDTVRNRYLLCQLISKATRKFHKPNTRVQETMNDVLVLVGEAGEADDVLNAPTDEVAETQRRAA